ncbi:hypothetical protein FRC11_013381 [Ceratobasidium sp. 423]|nr:hypothetical protein FRC11_013381 [Ceratobasidium sp. 423]
MHLAILMVNLFVTPRILIYSATAGYRHDSIPAATAALQQLGQQHGIAFDATEDKTQFNDNNLAKYDAILFLSNSDEVLDESGKQAFQTYLNKGGNYIGVHAASACLYNTTFYQNEVGALFDYHPELQPVTFLVLDKDHPSTTMLPDRWTYTEEVYNFRSDPRSVGAKVLLSVDTLTLKPTPKVPLIQLHGIKNGVQELRTALLLVEAFTPAWDTQLPHGLIRRFWHTWHSMDLGIKHNASYEPRRTSRSDAVKHVIGEGKHTHRIDELQKFSWTFSAQTNVRPTRSKKEYTAGRLLRGSCLQNCGIPCPE